MDLSAIKKNIESGQIRTTAEFQRDIMLMFQNAVMYNSSDHDVYHMALEMQRDVLEQIQQFLATQLIMQTSESGIGTKSLRGREANRKQDPNEKVRDAHVQSHTCWHTNPALSSGPKTLVRRLEVQHNIPHGVKTSPNIWRKV